MDIEPKQNPFGSLTEIDLLRKVPSVILATSKFNLLE